MAKALCISASSGDCSSEMGAVLDWPAIFDQNGPEKSEVATPTEDLHSFSTALVIKVDGFSV